MRAGGERDAMSASVIRGAMTDHKSWPETIWTFEIERRNGEATAAVTVASSPFTSSKGVERVAR